MKPSIYALLAAFICGAPVHAASNFEPGVYAGASVGQSSVSSKVVDSGNDPSFGYALGYQFNANLGAEIYGRTLSFRLFDALLGDTSYYPDTHNGIAVVGAVPLTDSLNFYARAGVGKTSMKSSRAGKDSYNETDVTYGVGMRYAFNPKWSILLEALRFNKTEVTTATLGVQYNF